VTKLYELEQDQTRDVRGALFDKGKHVLSKQAAILKVSYETWPQLLPEQRPVCILLNNIVVRLVTVVVPLTRLTGVS
jgi:hypothetical protein